jgi:hypothetical protein
MGLIHVLVMACDDPDSLKMTSGNIWLKIGQDICCRLLVNLPVVCLKTLCSDPKKILEFDLFVLRMAQSCEELSDSLFGDSGDSPVK